MSSNQTARTVESLFHSRSFTCNTQSEAFRCTDVFLRTELYHLMFLFHCRHLGLVSAERQGEVSVQEAVLLHEHHTVFVGMALSAGDQAAWGSEASGELKETHTFISRSNQSENQSRALLLPAERLLQAVDGLAGRLQDALPVPHPDLPGSALRTHGADSEQLTVASPGDPWPAVVPGCSWLHLLVAHDQIDQFFDLLGFKSLLCVTHWPGSFSVPLVSPLSRGTESPSSPNPPWWTSLQTQNMKVLNTSRSFSHVTMCL